MICHIWISLKIFKKWRTLLPSPSPCSPLCYGLPYCYSLFINQCITMTRPLFTQVLSGSLSPSCIRHEGCIVNPTIMYIKSMCINHDKKCFIFLEYHEIELTSAVYPSRLVYKGNIAYIPIAYIVDI